MSHSYPSGGVSASLANVAAGVAVLTAPAQARGVLVHCTNPIRVAVTESATALPVTDANFGYLPASTGGEGYCFKFRQDFHKTVQIRVESDTAIPVVYRLTWLV